MTTAPKAPYNETQTLVRDIGHELFSLALALDPAMRKLGGYRRLLLSARMEDLRRTHEELCHEVGICHMWQMRTAAHMLHVDAWRLRSRRAIIRAARWWLQHRRLA